MSFSLKIKETPQALLEGQEKLGACLIMTIPYNAPVDKMQGFVSVLGGSDAAAPLPVLTLCVQSPAGGAIVSTIVFRDDVHYLDFVDKLMTHAYSAFERNNKTFN